MPDVVPDLVLLHGSWLGGWVWDRVRSATAGAAPGTVVDTPTLAGLESATAAPAGLHDHVAQIADLLAARAEPVTLVAHSYAGMAAVPATARVPDRVARLILVDGFAPHRGQRALDVLPWLEAVLVEDPARPGFAPPGDFAPMGVTDPGDLAWLAANASAMPLATHTEAAGTGVDDLPAGTPLTYVHCTGTPFFDDTAAMLRARGHRVVDLASGHLPMVTHPRELAGLFGRLDG